MSKRHTQAHLIKRRVSALSRKGRCINTTNAQQLIVRVKRLERQIVGI